MPLRPPAGFISAFFDPLNNPDAPTIGAASAGDASASVEFTPPTNVGGSAISSYSALSNPGQIVGTAASSPISVTGLTNGTSYTFAVWATNTYGPSAYSASTGSVSPTAPQAFFAGGYVGGNYKSTIEYVNISTTGNAIFFGNLRTVSGEKSWGYMVSGASTSRGIYSGGNGDINNISYITFASAGNSVSFGQLNFADGVGGGAASWNGAAGSSSRGLLGVEQTTFIQYITIASTGNATNFGNFSSNRSRGGQFSSPTRSVFAGGSAPSNVIDYVTTATTGTATTFGALTSPKGYCAGAGSSTRGLIAGGYDDGSFPAYFTNTIFYVTIASTGNSTTFGNLTSGSASLAGSSSSTRAVFGGGENSNTALNTIGYVTIASTGNATAFGDLSLARYNLGCASNAHGGLQ
jgi:hypothetical protein